MNVILTIDDAAQTIDVRGEIMATLELCGGTCVAFSNGVLLTIGMSPAQKCACFLRHRESRGSCSLRSTSPGRPADQATVWGETAWIVHDNEIFTSRK